MQYIIYYRVSTVRQGYSGLGLEAQQIAVTDFFKNKSDIQVIGEFTEIISGKSTDRKQLNQAVQMAKAENATIVVARIDRIARNLRYFLELLDMVKLLFVDFPNLDPSDPDDRMILISMGNMADWEARKISQRTKQALKAKKMRGELMGVMGSKNIKATNAKRAEQAQAFAQSIAPTLAPLIGTMSLRQLASHLNVNGVKSPSGGRWHLSTLQNVIKRIA